MISPIRQREGAIVIVDWRDRLYPPEPGKVRPGVVLGNPNLSARLPVLTVIPLTGDARLAPSTLSVRIEPSAENGLTKTSYALVWNVQAVVTERIVTITEKIIGRADLADMRLVLAEYLAL